MKPLFQTVAWFVLPLALLLCIQWPLREWVQALSREANDLGQILFALYACVAVSAASAGGVHLAAYRAPSSTTSAVSPRWRSLALAACVLPWAAFVLWSSASSVLASLAQWEKFPETLNPGFFLIKVAAWLLALLALLHALVELFEKPTPSRNAS